MQILHLFPGARRAAVDIILQAVSKSQHVDLYRYYVRLLNDESDAHIFSLKAPPVGARIDLSKWVHTWTWPEKDCTTDDVIRHNAAVHEFYLKMLGHEVPEEITLKAEQNLPSLRIKAKFPNAKDSYIYCGICGHRPKATEAPNRGPVKWYDPDDGYRLGTLCLGCVGEVVLNERKPEPSDFCQQGDHTPINVDNTDEDVTALLPTS